jgi:acyl-coenzyme A synthetase/AMP-(fatty) acid ligase
MFPFETKHQDNSTAIITDGGTCLTYGDISNFSGKIHELIPRRCLLFSLCKNTAGSLLGYVSFLSNSIVPVMLDSNIDAVFLETLINTYRPKYLWLPDKRVNEFINHQVIFSDHGYSLVKLEEKISFALHPDLAMLLTTSGSTGSPKFVRISYENIISNTKSIASYLSIHEQDRPIINLPMWYSYGLSVVNTHLSKGATLLLTTKSIVEKDFWEFIRVRNASSLSGVPYTFEILKKLKFSEMSLPYLKTLTQAGGKLSEELHIYFSEYALNFDKRFFIMYGQTEATSRMSYLSPEHALKKPGSIGLPVPGSEFNIIDDNGNEVDQPDMAGELVYRGKNVSMGYSSCGDDLLKGDENNGILFTGDLAKKDEDGFYYITGRKNRYIKLFGNRINLDETENLVSKIISDCACTGSDDLLSVFITDETRLTEIKNYISAKTGIHPAAFSVQYRSEIPKNPTGKINYPLL